MTWRQFADRVEAVAKALDVDPNTLEIRYIDISQDADDDMVVDIERSFDGWGLVVTE
jgi:hypothetical protein